MFLSITEALTKGLTFDIDAAGKPAGRNLAIRAPTPMVRAVGYLNVRLSRVRMAATNAAGQQAQEGNAPMGLFLTALALRNTLHALRGLRYVFSDNA